jgi:thymidylate kinase
MHKKRRKQIRIALCGVDGSGKTTQAKLLKGALDQRLGSRRVAYSHGNRPLFKTDTKSTGSDVGIGTSRRNWFLSILILKKDLLKLWLYIFQNRGATVVIFDRYVEDALAKAKFHGQSSNLFETIVNWLGPKSELAIWLDVPPETSFARDQEHPIEYHRNKQQAYAEVFRGSRMSRCAVVSGNGSPDEIHAQVWRAVQNRLLSDWAGE